MSFTGAFVVAAICIARLSLKKAPKIISYCLWAVAGFRLTFPISIESVFSLVPFKAQTILSGIAAQPVPLIGGGIPSISGNVGNVLQPSPTSAVTNIAPLRIWAAIGSWVWLAGVAAMLIFGVLSYIRHKHKLDSAIRVEGNLYETDSIQSPFVLGVLKPKIYIPLNLSGQEYEYIILHEQTHIRRHDHIIKFAAYFILCIHWFNPLTWAAFLLMGMDMEMSCDERVLKSLGGKIKKDYSMSLLSYTGGRRFVNGSPLAFSEDSFKKRIKNVLKYKKTSRVAIVLAVAFVTVLSLGLLVSRASTDDLLSDTDDGANAEMTYIITDYYNNEDGKFSPIGLMLDEMNSERVLTVRGGDVLIIGDRRYEVTAESLTLSFYTQPSNDQVVQWWTDCLNSLVEGDKVIAVS